MVDRFRAGQDERVDELLQVAVETARAAGEVASRWQARLGALTVEHKTGPGDLVSEADREAEQAARAVLAGRRPDDAVVGEESAATSGTSGLSWYVDPVDGTTNFLYGRDDWCVSVAAWRDGVPVVAAVYEPVPDRLTTATARGGAWCDGVRLRVREPTSLDLAVVELGLGRGRPRAVTGEVFDALVDRLRDVRRGGSAAIALTNVALGRADAVWSPGLQPWDLAAGVLLVREAGGVVVDPQGTPTGVSAPSDVLAGAPGVVQALSPLLARRRD